MFLLPHLIFPIRIKDRSYVDPKSKIIYNKFALVTHRRVGDKFVESTILNLGSDSS
jgi:hypothetical protein